MSQYDIINLLKKNKNKYFTTKDIAKELKINSHSVANAIKKIMKFKNIKEFKNIERLEKNNPKGGICYIYRYKK